MGGNSRQNKNSCSDNRTHSQRGESNRPKYAPQTVFSSGFSTSRLNRKIEALVDYLIRANPAPSGSVLLTGTGIEVSAEAALAPGDVVSIRAEGIGELSNPVSVA